MIRHYYRKSLGYRVDRKGVVLLRWWVGALLFFALSVDGQEDKHWNFRLFPNPDGVPLAEVTDICEDIDDKIWVATWGEGGPSYSPYGMEAIHRSRWLA